MTRTLTDGHRTIELTDQDETDLAEIAAERERERLLLVDQHTPWNRLPRPWETVPERVTLFLPLNARHKARDSDGDPALPFQRTREATGYQPVEMRLLGEDGFLHSAFVWSASVHAEWKRTPQQVLSHFTKDLGLQFRRPPDPAMAQHRERRAMQHAQAGLPPPVPGSTETQRSCDWLTYQFILERLRDAVVVERVVLNS